ncbi:unnamed protein product [Amoebophrya sp. A25]|nr:unnamed protein product [Amoebophrya sp. A25]|eukprot:GSA25T00008976001.1
MGASTTRVEALLREDEALRDALTESLVEATKDSVRSREDFQVLKDGILPSLYNKKGAKMTRRADKADEADEANSSASASGDEDSNSDNVDDVIEALLAADKLNRDHDHLAFFNGFIVGTLRPTEV